MKLVTEFASFTLNKALEIKSKLLADGKTAEEIESTIGASFKFEGEKLKHFMNAIEVSSQNQTNLKRIFVATFAEGEATPDKTVKVEDTFYVPEFLILTPYVKPESSKRGHNGGGRGGKGTKKPSSPWGMSPEEKAAKNKTAGTPPTKPV